MSAEPEDITISLADAKVITAMMEEFWQRKELSPDESRVFLTLCSLTGIGRPVPEHGSGP